MPYTANTVTLETEKSTVETTSCLVDRTSIAFCIDRVIPSLADGLVAQIGSTGMTAFAVEVEVLRPSRLDYKRADALAWPKTVGKSAWDSPRIQNMLRQPVGAPIELTRDEALAIAKEAFGRIPSLPTGEEYVRQVRRIWDGLTERAYG